jgi:glycosyltransferase involved in cell wall biosynthesis
MSADLAVIVPALNAERTLPGTLARIARAAAPGTVVLVVDDGSRDGTAAAATRAGAELGLQLEVLTHPQNRGYGAAQKTAFTRGLALGCRYFILIHADGQYAPEELPVVLAPLLAGRADVVVGSRVAGGALRGGMPVLRWLGNRTISHLENLVFGLRFIEYHSGYVAYSRRALEAIAIQTLTDRYHFDGEMLLCAGKLGLPVVEVPVSTYFGPGTTSLAVLPYLGEIAQVLGRYLRRGYFFQQVTGR